MKRLAVISAVHTAQLLQHANNNNNSSQQYNMSVGVGPGGRSGGGRYETDLHGNVNILLGGAMLGGVIVVVFLVCYCCHRNTRKHRPHEYSQYWRPEPDVHSLEVFTMDSHAMCYERNAMSLNHLDELPTSATATTLTSLPARRPSTPGPPPAYESLIFKPYLTSPSDKKPDFGSCILPVPIDLERGMHQHQQQQQQQQQQYHHHHHHHNHHRRSLGKDDEDHSSRHVIDHDEGLPSYEAALKLEAHGYV